MAPQRNSVIGFGGLAERFGLWRKPKRYEQRRGRSGTVVIVAAALVSTIVGCAVLVLASMLGKKEMPRTVALPGSITLRLNGPFDASLAGPILAWRMGLFAKEGVEVALKPGGSEAEIVDSVSAGADMIGMVRSETFLLARAHGKHIVAFAAGYLESPVTFFATGQTGVTGPRDFIGKRVGYRQGDDTAFVYEGLLAKLKIPRNRIREEPTANDPSALVNGEIDVWPGHVSDDAQFLCRVATACNVIRPADFGLHIPGSVYFVSEATLRDNPEVLRRFVRGLIAGWKFAYSNDDRALATLSAVIGPQQRARLVLTLVEQQDVIRPPGTRYAEFDESSWRSLVGILISAKVLAAPIDFSEAVTFDVLRETYRQPISFDR